MLAQYCGRSVKDGFAICLSVLNLFEKCFKVKFSKKPHITSRYNIPILIPVIQYITQEIYRVSIIFD